MIDSCIVCQSKNTKEFMRLHDHLVSKELFVLSECQECGFRYINNPPPAEQAGRYYETEEYVEHSDSSSGLINTFYHFARRWMLRYKHRLIAPMAANKRILDFGTGTGYFLNHMKQQGYETHGIEISEKGRLFGQKEFGLDIYPPEQIHESSFPSQFGVITFWHVLEHVYEPHTVMHRLNERMDDDGVMVVALPNYHCLEAKYYKNYWNGYDVPRHLWHWDSPSFHRFAESCGFEVVRKKILPLDPFYNCLISESYRKSTLGYLVLPFIGALSLLQGLINTNKASSIVYFLKKKKV